MAKKNKKKKGKALKRRDIEQLLAAQLNMAPARQGMLAKLSDLLPKGRTEQFLLGLLVGGATAYVLADEELRGKVFKGAMKAYASVMGSMSEMKEQLADVAAEVEAEASGTI